MARLQGEGASAAVRGLPAEDQRDESGRALPIQSSPVGACLEDTMSVSGDLPSIGAPTVGGKCPDPSGETLVKCLHGFWQHSPQTVVRRVSSHPKTSSA